MEDKTCIPLHYTHEQLADFRFVLPGGTKKGGIMNYAID